MELDLLLYKSYKYYMNGTRLEIIRLPRTTFDPQHSITLSDP